MYNVKKFNYFSEQHGAATIKIVEDAFKEKTELTEFIFIEAPTKCGKSTFVLNNLYEYAKTYGHKILLLIPRTALKTQFVLDTADKSDIILVQTYQHFEQDSTKAIDEVTGVYDIVVCDEAHYFTADCRFNYNTYVSLERIIKMPAVTLFMTATPDTVKPVIKKKLDKLVPDYNLYTKMGQGVDIIKDIKFFGDEHMSKQIGSINALLKELEKTEDKAIIFCYSVEEAYSLYEKWADKSMFVCSESNDEYKDKMDKAARDKMLRDKKFDCKYLFTTSALEVGVTLKDQNLKHIICTLKNIESIEQAIGRKRPIDGIEDTVMVWLNNRSENEIGGTISEIKNKAFSRYNYYIENGKERYKAKFNRNPDKYHIITEDQNITEQINHVIDESTLETYQRELEILEEINALPYHNDNYRAWIYDHFHKTPFIKRRAYGITKRLEALIGKKYSKKKLVVIAEAVNCRRDNGELVMSLDAINQYLKDNGVKMEVRKGKNEKTRRNYYYVTKLEGAKTNEKRKETSNKGTARTVSGSDNGLLLHDTGRYTETLVS